MGGDPDRIAHVVQAVKACDQFVSLAVVMLGIRHLERYPLRQTRLGCRGAGLLDRRRMIVETEEPRIGKGIRQDDSRRDMAATHVRNAATLLQSRCDAVQGGKPLPTKWCRWPVRKNLFYRMALPHCYA